MPDVDQDELHGGPERTPRGIPRWLQPVAVTVVIVVLGALALKGPDSPGSSPDPPASADPSASSAPATEDVVGAGTGPLALGAVCTHTDGTRSLQVQFQVLNAGIARVTVMAVRAVLPVGGLRPTRVVLPRSPSCGTPAARTGPSTLLEPGERVGVQLDFRLPPECPAPYPVQADIDVLVAGESPGTQRLAVLPDLGDTHFAACDQD